MNIYMCVVIHKILPENTLLHSAYNCPAWKLVHIGNEAARNVSQREEVSHRLGIYIIFEDEGGDVCLLASSQSLGPLRIVGHTYGLL